MNVQTIREGLGAACATIAGLTDAPTIPENVNGNTAVINPDDLLKRGTLGFIEYNQALNGGLTSLNFEVILLVPIANGLDRAQNTLDGYLSAGTGETASVVDAVNAINKGGVTVAGMDEALVESCRNYAMPVDVSPPCISARLTVVVRASRS